MMSDNEEIDNNKDWQLRSHIDYIHIEYYDPIEVELLRKLLLDDIQGLVAVYGVECDPQRFVEIIDRRFGLE